ncbi:paired amphipathic helix protein Sin3a [Caerostris extrusa]|uniref:Paired amphipathic helix protein Sin3a n=1 Tax=Caerostris extrusa TaxID=172846 RepID=A0AAV4S9Y6_CAEEX|nr:paired amphipathic helix protein Sin3a [Caerostris extrusa]
MMSKFFSTKQATECILFRIVICSYIVKTLFPKAKEIHQAVSEIKTSNFNAWHTLWLEKYVTPPMLKSCNEWLLKTERNRFISQRITVSEYAKPPYIPYYKYMVRYYQFEKDEEEEEMNTE